jgi:hypothetical protein
MTTRQAIVRLDHAQAELLGLGNGSPQPIHLHARRHDTRQHHSQVRDGHEFFGAVCGAIDAFDEVLLVGSQQATADFERYMRKHHPETVRRVVARETVDRPTPGELTAFGRAFFERRLRLGGVFEQAD